MSKKLDQTKLEEIKKYHNLGNTNQEIANILNIYRTTIDKYIKQQGLIPHRKMKYSKIEGVIFGRLTVLKYIHSTINKVKCWECRCSCGNITIVESTALMRKNRATQSCGCLQKELFTGKIPKNMLEKGEACCRALWYGYRKNPKTRNIKFNIDYDIFKKLTSSNCEYCNIEPKQRLANKSTNGIYLYNGLDRIDSEKDYDLNNVVPCCKACNYAKRVMTLEEFKNWITRVYTKTILKEIL